MKDGVTVVGLDASLIQDALRHYLPEKEVSIVSSPCLERDGKVYIWKNELSDIENDLISTQKLLHEKDDQIKNIDSRLQMALESVQKFHKQQTDLYQDFLVLREKYDAHKLEHTATLWTHCLSCHHSLTNIPREDQTLTDTPQSVGSYKISNILGEGHFGEVFECHLDDNPKELAIKVIRKDKVTSFHSLRRISNEIGTTKKLNNRCIVKIVDIVHTRLNLYIVMEKGGRDMFDFFDQHPDGAREEWALEIMAGILEGVLHCHAHGVCHRDLKPENVLLTFDVNTGKCMDLKLCDFGLSTVFRPAEPLSEFCGSPGFFAPEMFTRGSYYGDKIDVWSTGCILLELTLGHERFYDIWMHCYDMEVMRDKEKFSEIIQNSTNSLQEFLPFSEDLKKFIVAILQVDDSTRPTAQGMCSLPWMGGRFADLISSSLTSAHPSDSGANIPNGPGTSPYKKVLKTAQVSKARQKHSNKVGDVSLPPIEPATPSVGKARKIMRQGDQLAKGTSGIKFDENDSDQEEANL
mmetsp:Transcript_1869/g.2969  ORF Transcript_1869/g.2969 Transcript_1869/m.2969 type:complete len:521 (-) Transcript_1869:117-1679(-)|eukprot:CAMPEP_0185028788 /NCGR_PEP_ID=MMETSP1103-20130426/14778_1 /TAXON_ID=36769 /ORGANISM="Paraphysomonas bandaiensis, Strain Caron Lab Isolate" /LENGTH=520 /DNA_ID=CAMNT_0027563315 /DNA_START=142 /DNA_END=1704 /DNA_ORIENTATION=+